MIEMVKRHWRAAVVALVFGFIGLGLSQSAGCVYQDLAFLHRARVFQENAERQQQARPQQAPTPPVK